MRPDLDGPSLQSLLVGYAEPGGASVTEAGAGTFRLGTSAVGEVAAQPTTLGFGIWGGPRWHGTRTVVVRNVSSRRLQLSVSIVSNVDPEALGFKVTPDRVVLGIGDAVRVKVRIVAPSAARAAHGHRRDQDRCERAARRFVFRGRSASSSPRQI